MGNILIVAEQKDGALRGATLNAVTFGRKLAEAQGGEVHGLVVGQGVGDAAAELAKYVAKVYSVDDAGLGSYLAETYAPVVAKTAKAAGANAIVATATATGKDLLPRVAAVFGCGMVAEVSDIAGPKTFKRPMLAGNAIGKVEVLGDNFCVSIRQTEWAAAEPAGSAGSVEASQAGDLETFEAEVTKLDLSQSARPDLAEAKVVVSGGRGMKSSENFQHLEKLADIFGGALGATRAACDAGMVANDLQVGQTGKVVAPDLYIAVGISGAIQHLAGMKGSKVIVAINKDAEAPIFQVADYGLVAKWEDSLEDLTAKVAAIKAE